MTGMGKLGSNAAPYVEDIERPRDGPVEEVRAAAEEALRRIVEASGAPTGGTPQGRETERGEE